jgi:large subunit ribosomal protein L10
MSIARTQKEENASRLREELSGVPHAILVDFKGLNVEGATNLRRKLREGDASFKVVKNSTILRAIEDLPLADLNEHFVGQTAVAYTDGDAVNLAKVLSEFAKDFATPNFKAGMVDGAPISQEQFEQLAKLPPREELIAKALYLMNYPLTGLATALSGILKGFVVVLEQIRAQKEEAGEAEPAAEAAPQAAEEAPAEEAAADDGGEDAPAEEAAADDGGEEAPAEEAAADDGGEDAPAEEAAADDGGEEAPAEEAAADESADEAPAEAAAEEAAEESADEETPEDAGDEAGGEEDEDKS